MTAQRMTRSIPACALAFSLAALTVACGDEDKPATAATADAVLAAWTEAGFDVAALQPLEKHDLGKADCRRGPIGGVETTLCVYENEGAASVARSAGLARVGDATGAALVRGRMMLVVADRDKADPEGKTINKMTRIFLGRE